MSHLLLLTLLAQSPTSFDSIDSPALTLVSKSTPATNPLPYTILDFCYQGCIPCQEMRPIIAELKRLGYPIKEIIREEDPTTTEQYQVTLFPTFVIVDGMGREYQRYVGKQTSNALADAYWQVYNTNKTPLVETTRVDLREWAPIPPVDFRAINP
jgi:thiol-disulfide isomerase/thioredoxin